MADGGGRGRKKRHLLEGDAAKPYFHPGSIGGRMLQLMKPGTWYTTTEINRIAERSGLAMSRYQAARMFLHYWRTGILRRALNPRRDRSAEHQLGKGRAFGIRKCRYVYRLSADIEAKGMAATVEEAGRLFFEVHKRRRLKRRRMPSRSL
jgi:hypothetical protein